MPHKLRAWDLEAFLASDYSWHTKNLGLIAVRMWHRWGAERRFWERDPELLDLKLRRQALPAPKALTLDQARLLISLARSPVEKRIVFLGLYAGLRPGEIREVSSKDWFVTAAGEEVIRVQGKRTSPERDVPVHPRLSMARSELVVVAMTRRQMLRVVRGFREPLGVEDFSAKWLRATFGQALQGLGVERDVISALLGHAVGSVTATSYVPVSRQERIDAIRRLHYGDQQMRLAL